MAPKRPQDGASLSPEIYSIVGVGVGLATLNVSAFLFLWNQMNGRFNDMNGRFNDMNERFNDMNGRFNDIYLRFGQVEDRFAQMTTQIQHLASEISGLAQRVARLEGHLRIPQEPNGRGED